jgi:hypothetical protein
VWLDRARFWLTAAALFAAFHYIVDGLALSRGLNRPVVILSSAGGMFAAPLVLALLWMAAYFGPAGRSPARSCDALVVAGLALAAWSATGGTIDDWLVLMHPRPGPPTGGPYWLLLFDYLFLLLAIAGVAVVATLRDVQPGASNHERSFAYAVRRTFALDRAPAAWRHGVAALLITAAIATTLFCVLYGPPVAQTRRGQTWFATFVAFGLGAMIARRLVPVRDPVWFWLAPFVVGIAATVLAGIRPALMLPAEFAHLDTQPAWGPVRPLPIEMVGVGLIATVIGLRAGARSTEPSGTGAPATQRA